MSVPRPSRPEETRFVLRTHPRVGATVHPGNDTTQAVAPWQLTMLESLAASPDDAFRRALPRLYDAARRLDGDGVVYAATHLDDVVAWGGVRARAARPNIAVIGRHLCADMALDEDPTLSLRHVAVIVHPWLPGGPRRLRLVDLHSGLGSTTGAAGPVGAVEADDFLHLASGGFHFFAVTTRPGGGDLPTAEELGASFATFSVRSAPTAPPAPDGSRVLGHLHLMGVDGVAVGPGPETSTRRGLPVTAAAIGRGFTLGRYPRASLCLSDGVEQLTCLSRMHALITDVDDRLWIFDTASTNGLYVNRREVRLAELPRRGVTVIGIGPFELVWVGTD